MTADKFGEVSPRAAEIIKTNSYVDDLCDSVESYEVAQQVANEIESILLKGNFKMKPWVFGGKGVPAAGNEDCTVNLSKSEQTRVLGIGYRPIDDVIFF